MDIGISQLMSSAIHLAFLLQYQLVSACENGWTPDPHRRACFKLYKDRPRDWPDAKSHCARNGAYLTDMSGFAEQKFINDSVLKDVHIDYGVWLGATDEGWIVTKWKWVNGNNMNIDLFLWRKGNPDNGKVKIESKLDGENCLQMTTESGYRGQLNDYYCKRKLPFVCKNRRMYAITTTPFIQTSTTQQSTGKSSRPGKSGNSETPVIVICLLVSFLLISVVVTVILILRRRRNNLALANVYEDMADPSPNENVYTGLAGTSGDDNGANIAVRPPIKTPPVNQSLQENYLEPYLYDRPTEISVSESQKTGQNNSSLKPGMCLPYIQKDYSKSTDGNPSRSEVQIRQNKGVKGQQCVTSPSGYIDMNRHYEEIVDGYEMSSKPGSLTVKDNLVKKGSGKEAGYEISSKPGSLTVKDNLVKKGSGKEAYNVDKNELPSYYLTPKSEALHQKAKK